MPKRADHGWFRHLLLVLACLLVSVSTSILLCELLTRKFAPQCNPSGMVTFTALPDGTPVLSRRNETFRQWKESGDYDVSIYSNYLGLRNRKDLAYVDLDAWYVVGDSFAFGWGVEERYRFSDRMEKLGVGPECVNISIPTDIDGYDKLLRYAKRNSARINRLIIGVCMENDIHMYDQSAGAAPEPSGNARERATWQEIMMTTKIVLAENSALYNLATSVVHHNQPLKRIAAAIGLLAPNVPTANLPNREEIESTVSRLATLRTHHNVRPLLLIIPSRRLWSGKEQELAIECHDYFVQRLLEEGFNVVDPRASFERSGMPLKYHFSNDGHWNAMGHELVANLLRDTILATPTQLLRR